MHQISSDIPTRALIIDDPWITLILQGRKTWEMRSTRVNIRGSIGLIRKGSGLVVATAELTDCLSPLDAAAYSAALTFHAIPPERQAQAIAGGWIVPWVLCDIRLLACPVPYEHPDGAVKWVKLEDCVSQAIAAQQAATTPLATGQMEVAPVVAQVSASITLPPATHTATTTAAPANLPFGHRSAASAAAQHTGVVRLTDGNIRNGHIYLRTVERLLPADALGGPNNASAAPRTITVTFEPGSTVETDVPTDKMIFRKRGPVRAFFAASSAQAGDEVVITRTASHTLHVTLQTRAGTLHSPEQE